MRRRTIRPLPHFGRPIDRSTLGKLDPPQFIFEVCRTSANPRFWHALASDLQDDGIADAVKAHDLAALFNWLIRRFARQGIADQAAETFIERNGLCDFKTLSTLFDTPTRAACEKLVSYSTYCDCRYKRAAHSCSHPQRVANCLVPLVGGRKGILSEAAVSLFLFIRDVAKNDLVAFIDGELKTIDYPGHPDLVARQRETLMAGFRGIRGISDKVIAMTFADLLLGGDPARRTWVTVGASMIAIDTLVHNFLIRTGILSEAGMPHAYGPGCYRSGSCAEVLDRIARCIDARAFNRSFPAYFPRFVQHAIWAFCAEAGWGICNGRTIDDTDRCQHEPCPVFTQCSRVSLRSAADS